jgi:hypothetical protein
VSKQKGSPAWTEEGPGGCMANRLPRIRNWARLVREDMSCSGIEFTVHIH